MFALSREVSTFRKISQEKYEQKLTTEMAEKLESVVGTSRTLLR